MEVARIAIETAEERRRRLMSRSYQRKGKSSAEAGRKRAAKSLSAYHVDISLGAAAGPEYRQLCIATYHPIARDDIEGLGVFHEIFDMESAHRAPSKALPMPILREPVAHVDVHVLKRLAQRSETHDLDGMLAHLRPALAWSLVAEREKVRGNFFVPTEDGLYCCERTSYLGDRSGHDHVVRIKTFLHADEMNSFSRASHELLRQEGVPEVKPKFPTMRPVRNEERTSLYLMARLGAEWEERCASRSIQVTDPAQSI